MKKYIFIIMLYFSCNKTEINLEAIIGVDDVTFNEEFSSGDYLSISGEGYSISIYNISKESTMDFLNSNKKLSYPEYKEGFKHVSWTKTPLKNELNEVIDLTAGQHSRNEKVLSYQKEIRKNLIENNSYYAIDYKEIENNIVEAYLYIYNLKTRKLYCIYNNT